MAPARLADRPIQPRLDEFEEEYFSEGEEDEQEDQSSADHSQSDSEAETEDADSDPGQLQDKEEDNVDGVSEEEPEELESISFGALAKAQEAFAPPSRSRKRKLSSLQSPTEQEPKLPIDNPHPTHDIISKKPKQDLTGRSSKHAPAVSSSRHPVSRKRALFSPPPVLKSRDPRFDPTITARSLNPSSVAQADKAYSFLTDYQATEILQLKTEIKKSQAKNPEHAADLKRKLMSMEARLRNAEKKNQERQILQKHKSQEKQAIKEGKKDKAYFLKKSDLKKEIERERVEGMGKKQRDTMEKRKRMREKRKEARDMPWARRMG